MIKLILLAVALVALPASGFAADAKKKADTATEETQRKDAGGCMPDGSCCGGTSGSCAEAMAEHRKGERSADDDETCPCKRARKAKEQQQQEAE